MASYSFLNVKQPLATFKLLLVTFAFVEFFFYFKSRNVLLSIFLWTIKNNFFL